MQLLLDFLSIVYGFLFLINLVYEVSLIKFSKISLIFKEVTDHSFLKTGVWPLMEHLKLQVRNKCGIYHISHTL